LSEDPPEGDQLSRHIVVCTGHRKIADSKHEMLIWQAVKKAICRADEMVFGGAMGFDALALHAAWTWKTFANNPQHADHVREKYGDKMAKCDLVVVVPATIKEQPEITKRLIAYFEKATPGYIRVLELNLAYNAETLKKRNHVMCDRTDFPDTGEVLAYWSGEHKSGTYSCIHYARERKKLPVNVIDLTAEPDPPPKISLS